MRFKDLVEEVLTIAKRGAVSAREVARIDSILTNSSGELSDQEKRTLGGFFWGAAQSSAWLSSLRKHILDCPPVVVTEKGYQVPVWFAEPYVRTQIKNQESSALKLLFEITSNNARFYDVVAEAAITVPPSEAKTLLPLLLEYANNQYSFTKRKLIPVLSRFAAEGLISEALSLGTEIVRFGQDPATAEKRARRLRDPLDWTITLEPRPRFDEWEYKELLEKGIPPLAKVAPLDTARLLISATAEMLQLRSPKEGGEQWSDTSEIWATRVDQPERYDIDPKSALIRVLTYCCEQVYEQTAEDSPLAERLDEMLRAAKWLVFTRVRQHLYSKYPLRAKEWIRQEILDYPRYESWEYHFEFQRMVRASFECFGQELLTSDELKSILERIFSGPDKDQFKEFMGDQYTEESFQARQRHFRLLQLRPFEAVLFGNYKQEFDSLSREKPPPTDDDYSPYPIGESKTGGSRSPKPVDEMLAMTDDQLVAFLNEWDNPHRDPKEWWVDIDFRGVGIALKEAIKRNPERFLAWGPRWHSIKRPIYFSYVLEVGNNWLKEKKATELTPWLNLSEWIMQQPYISGQAEEQPDDSTESRDWDSARRAVVDLVEVCLAEETAISVEWRSRLFELTRAASLGPDRYLDSDKPLITPRDYLTDAINTTRGRALQNLIQYGFWVRHERGEAVEVPEVFQVLGQRFNAEPALSYPEYALLGTEFNRMLVLNEQSARQYSPQLFPLDNAPVWQISFAHYLVWDRAFKALFDLLRQHFEFALESISSWAEKDEQRSDPVAHLGEHLFAHYVWANDNLENDTGLLRQFYEKTSSKQWATLFDHVGRSLKNSPVDLEVHLKERCKVFFEFRLLAHNADELQEFMFWLEAECLETDWRLNAFLRTLEVTKGKGRHTASFLEGLNKLLPEQPRLVVQCFAKLTEAALHEEYFYVQSDQAMPILGAGLRSEDAATRDAAMTAQDNLLRAGHSEFLNVGEPA